MGELANKMRNKYPGVYDDLSDADLETKITAKYPGVYDDLVGKSVSAPRSVPTQQSPEGEIMGVPKWGRKYPNIYGAYGAGKALASEGLKLGGMAGGAALGAFVPVPGATLAGGGLGYAGATEASRALGLEPEGTPTDFSGGRFLKNILSGATQTGIGKLVGAAGKAGLNVLERKAPEYYAALAKTPLNRLSSGRPEFQARATVYPPEPVAPVKPKTPVAALRQDIADLGEKITPAMGGTSAKKQFALNKAMPLTTSKDMTPKALRELQNNREIGADAIGQFKDDIVFNRNGKLVKGGVPENAAELSEAIPQAKTAVWKRISAIDEAADAAGVKVPIANAITALQGFGKSRAVGLAKPSLINKANEFIEKLTANHPSGEMSVKEASEYVKTFNEILDDAYKSGKIEDTDSLKALAVMTNNIRGALVESVGKINPDYRGLRKMYGGIDALEPDAIRAVVKATNKSAAKNLSWLDIVAAEEAIGAAVSPHPAADLTRAATAKALSGLRYQNINKSVKDLFRIVDRTTKPFELSPMQPVTQGPKITYDPSTGKWIPATGQGIRTQGAVGRELPPSEYYKVQPGVQKEAVEQVARNVRPEPKPEPQMVARNVRPEPKPEPRLTGRGLPSNIEGDLNLSSNQFIRLPPTAKKIDRRYLENAMEANPNMTIEEFLLLQGGK